MFLNRRYILLGLVFCFFIQISAANKVPKLKKNQTDTCFPTLTKEFASLNKLINQINDNYNDNFLSVLPVWNYHFVASNRQIKNLSSFLSLSTNAIHSAKNKSIDYCPNIADIYTMKGIALLYMKEYEHAYQIFDTIVSQYKYARSWMTAYLWQAQTSLFLEDYVTAEYLLFEIQQNIDTLDAEDVIHYEILSADLLIKTYQYEQALTHLLKLEQILLDAEMKTRVKFIIAQIYDNIGKYALALPYYKYILKQRLSSKLMYSYAVVYKHFDERLLEQQQMPSISSPLEINAEPEEFEPTIVESYHDSTFFETDYPYYFNDLAAMFFLDESGNGVDDFLDSLDYMDDHYELHLTTEILESIFENWDSLSIHIPKTDFSNMTDTVYLPLIEEGKEYTLPHFNPVISRFGWRRYRYHYGIDTKNSIGDSIYCVFNGIVRIAKRNRTYGNVIIIRHYNGLETFYAHCSKLLVEPNQEVKVGDLIALVGSTGRSTGPHLHFETRYKGAAFNPEYMIDFENGKLLFDTLVITKETFNYRRSGNSSSSVSSSGADYYRVRSGDTLSTIARKHRTTVATIKRLNGLKSDFIREGQRLRVR
jgi:murein DD-endopeptidase MepM/ murein hydrolase activator NlpD